MPCPAYTRGRSSSASRLTFPESNALHSMGNVRQGRSSGLQFIPGKTPSGSGQRPVQPSILCLPVGHLLITQLIKRPCPHAEWRWRSLQQQQEAASPGPWRTISRDGLQGHQSGKLVLPHCSPFSHRCGRNLPQRKLRHAGDGARGEIMDNPPKSPTSSSLLEEVQGCGSSPKQCPAFSLTQPS